MSFITASGNLTGPITLATTEDGRTSGTVNVICETSSRDETGQWKTSGRTVYYLHVFGRAAENLAHTQTLAGNRAVIFTGALKTVDWTDETGQPRTTHHVYATFIGLDLARAAYERAHTPAPRFTLTPTQPAQDSQEAPVFQGAPHAEPIGDMDWPQVATPGPGLI